MEKITNITDEQGGEHVIIAYADGSFTSMLKSTYNELKANEPSNKL
jgi:hypothetical protein